MWAVRDEYSCPPEHCRSQERAGSIAERTDLNTAEAAAATIKGGRSGPIPQNLPMMSDQWCRGALACRGVA